MTEIREMQLDDLEQVMVIEQQNFSTPWTEMGFFSFLMREDTLFLVAEENGQILGYMGMMMVIDEAEITNVSVSQTARRRGIGRLLVQTMLDKMKERGMLVVHLEVRKSNMPAITLYESFGFMTDGVRKLYYEAPAEDAILMSCKLEQ